MDPGKPIPTLLQVIRVRLSKSTMQAQSRRNCVLSQSRNAR